MKIKIGSILKKTLLMLGRLLLSVLGAVRFLVKKLGALLWFFVPKKMLSEAHYRWTTIDSAKKFLVGFLILFVGSGVAIGRKLSIDHREIRETRCLAMNLYHEARGEPVAGKYAVAEVTMNRVKSNRYPNDVCEVVYQRTWVKRRKGYVSAFSWTTDKQTDIPKESEAWLKAVHIARKVYYDESENYTKDALYYHADYVKPYWAKKMRKTIKIGKHIFYTLK